MCAAPLNSRLREHGSARTSCSFLSPAGLLSTLMNQISLHIVPRWLTQFVLLCLSSIPGPQSFYFLRYSSPLPQSIKFWIWLCQRWTPSLCRHRPATFHHLKITWRTRELSTQAFSTKRIISETPWLCYIVLMSSFFHYLSCIWFLSLLIKFFGVGFVFLGSCGICCSETLSLDSMPWKL